MAILTVLKGIALLGKVTFGAVIGYALTNWRLIWMLLNSRSVEENIDDDINLLRDTSGQEDQ
ncbi:MAG TPA: hypothetical protein VKG92_02245 [Flavobacteriales bacterium]|nr:hypothetical protein [Flavobacteriales bacterium]